MLLSNPYICPRECPKRSAYCHNVETCEQYRKFRELNEEINEKKRQEAFCDGITFNSVQASRDRRRKKG